MGRGEQGPIALGTVLDQKYQLERVIGLGSMGAVYLARDLVLERTVAIKVLLARYAASKRVARSFRREAVAMARVRHPNVVQIFTYGDHVGLPYFVMEHMPGPTVARFLDRVGLQRKTLSVVEVLGILAQVCQGLEAVHQQGIVHRDVKPANMLMDNGSRVAITDFGLVQAVSASTSTAASSRSAPKGREDRCSPHLAGTPMYLAPELISGQMVPRHKAHRCDIYSLGISTFELLAGRCPFDGRDVPDVLSCHLRVPPPPVTRFRPDLPAAFDLVLARAMNKDPLARFRSCAEFFEACADAARLAPAPRARRILVVGPDHREQSVFSTALQVGIPEAVVLSASDGAAALDLVRASHPDLILLDLEVPELDGLEVCACLCGDLATADIPILVFSSRVEQQTRSLLQSLGAREVLAKPVEPRLLVELARRHLSAR